MLLSQNKSIGFTPVYLELSSQLRLVRIDGNTGLNLASISDNKVGKEPCKVDKKFE